MKNGMVHIYYGDGKGKSTSAVGVIIRALGCNLKIALFKFFKPRNISGEDGILEKYKNITIFYSKYSHPRIVKNGVSRDYKIKSFRNQKELFLTACKLFKKKYDIIILDEVLDLIPDKIIKTGELLELIKSKNKNMELILTGHYINKKLIASADLVTEMKKIKHYYDKNIVNRKGIES